MTRQPLLILKTKNGTPIPPMMHFYSTREAKDWLRKEGCRFSNGDLAQLGDDVVELVTAEYEYEIERDIEPERRRRSNGQVKD